MVRSSFDRFRFLPAAEAAGQAREPSAFVYERCSIRGVYEEVVLGVESLGGH